MSRYVSLSLELPRSLIHFSIDWSGLVIVVWISYFSTLFLVPPWINSSPPSECNSCGIPLSWMKEARISWTHVCVSIGYTILNHILLAYINPHVCLVANLTGGKKTLKLNVEWVPSRRLYILWCVSILNNLNSLPSCSLSEVHVVAWRFCFVTLRGILYNFESVSGVIILVPVSLRYLLFEVTTALWLLSIEYLDIHSLKEPFK